MTTSGEDVCPTLTATQGNAECSRRLVLSDCLARWQREAGQGTIDTGRYRARYFVWGQGPTLVLVPGLCSSRRSFIPLIARLSSRFRCVAYDLPGEPDDGARLDRYRHADLVADLFAILDHLDIKRCALLGQSFGSTVVLASLLEQPTCFDRGILQSGFARRPLATAEVFAAHWARYCPGQVHRIPLRIQAMKQNHAEPFRQRDESDWRYYLESQGRTPIKTLAYQALLMHRLDLRPKLSQITQPMLLICGDRDPLVARHYQHELMQGLPIPTQAEIEECGHHAHLSHPEVMAEVMTRFLLANS